MLSLKSPITKRETTDSVAYMRIIFQRVVEYYIFLTLIQIWDLTILLNIHLILIQ